MLLQICYCKRDVYIWPDIDIYAMKLFLENMFFSLHALYARWLLDLYF